MMDELEKEHKNSHRDDQEQGAGMLMGRPVDERGPAQREGHERGRSDPRHDKEEYGWQEGPLNDDTQTIIQTH